MYHIIKSAYNAEDEIVHKLLKWLQSTPKITTFRVNTLKSHCNAVISKINSYINLRNEQEKLSMLEKPKVYQLFEDTVVVENYERVLDLRHYFPEGRHPEVIVDAACGAAVLRGAHVFAPGVMALPPNIEIDDVVLVYADLSGSCKKGLKTHFDPDRKMLVGKGRLKMQRHLLYGENLKPSGIAVEIFMTASDVPVIDKNIFEVGECLLQNLPSIICSKVLDPQPGDFVLDMCAAPGNKTSHLANIMRNQGLIIALDKVPNKLDSIKLRCKEHDITCVNAFTFDSTRCFDVTKDSNEDVHSIFERGPPFPLAIFDKVLLDAPCSALGQRPLLKCNLSIKMLNSYVPLQKNLFRAAVKVLKRGGKLVYSTCTIAENECEKLVAWALQNFPELDLVPAKPIYGHAGKYDCGLDDAQRVKVQRFCLSDAQQLDCGFEYSQSDPFLDTLGFFIACFVKK